MKELKREVVVLIQYLVLLFVAQVAAFLWMLSNALGGSEIEGEELAEAININEAWKNVDGYVWAVLLFFGALGVVRLLTIFLAKSARAKFFD